MHKRNLQDIEQRRLARIARHKAAKFNASKAGKAAKAAKAAASKQRRKAQLKERANWTIEQHMAAQEEHNAKWRHLEMLRLAQKAYAMAVNQGIDVHNHEYWQKVDAAIRKARRR